MIEIILLRFIYLQNFAFVQQFAKKQITILYIKIKAYHIQMTYKLPELKYSKQDFPNQISQQTFQFHYGKHHQSYINNLNQLVQNTQWENTTLQNIIIKCQDQKIFNNAAQHYNHSFYWKCISPDINEPSGMFLDKINQRWGSKQKLQAELISKAVDNFGSGWTWLVKDKNNLQIVNTTNANCPITESKIPLLTIDVWQHAYYIDYRNARKSYVQTFVKLIDWKFAQINFETQKPKIGI